MPLYPMARGRRVVIGRMATICAHLMVAGAAAVVQLPCLAQTTPWNTNGSSIWYSPAGINVGIGTTSPSQLLHMANGSVFLDNNGSYNTFALRTSQNNSSGNYSANMILATGGCTVAAPCEMNTAYGSYFGSVTFRSLTGLGTVLGGMMATIPQSHTSASRPMSLEFLTTAAGSVTPSTVLHLDANTNVGIGTTAPTFRLQVAAATSGDGIAIRRAGTGAATVLQFQNEIGTSGAKIYTSGSNDALTLGAAGGSDAQTILANGNVGIGTTNPSTRLQVVTSGGGNLYASDYGCGAYGGIGFSQNMAGCGNYSLLGEGTNTFLNRPLNGALYFRENNSTEMVLAAGGNVGIGTMNPTSKLSVNGTVQAKEVVVNTGWADYVFAPAYRLKPLSEVATYIRQNHHLPEIPSEAEVRDKGVGLGEMQSKLLAKIEELTLHMIQEHERNDRLEQKIQDLQKQNVELRERQDGKQ